MLATELKREIPQVLFLVVAIVVSSFFGQLRTQLCEQAGTSEMFVKVASHDGLKPWQYRILIPALAGVLLRLQLPGGASLLDVAKVLEVVFMTLVIIAFRRYLFLLLQQQALATILSFSLFLILPFHLFLPRPYYASYWFDTPSMLTFTLGLIFLYEQRGIPYYALFLIGTFNRETTCFLTVIYLLTALGREKPARLAAHCVAQLSIWMAIKITLGKIYLNNPGPNGFEWYDRPGRTHYTDNLQYFMRPKNYPAFMSIMGFTWIPILLCYKRIKNTFVQRSLWMIVPYFTGIFLVANIYELRIFTELIPLFLAAFILILFDLAGCRPPLSNGDVGDR